MGLELGLDARHGAHAPRRADRIRHVALDVGRDTGRHGCDRREREPGRLVAPVAGHWIWTWTWTGSNGVTSSFSFDQACSCSWVWSWTWSGDPPTAPTPAAAAPASAADAAAAPATDAAPVQDTPDITQTNSSAATASAAASLAQTQDAGLAAGPDVVQVVSTAQRATATAQATQTRPSNVNIVTAGILDGLSQANTVEATAGATVDLTISQTATRATDDAAAGAPTASTQTIGSTQTATADAQAVQVDATNLNTVASLVPSSAEIAQVEQQNAVGADAFGGSTGSVDQHVSQSQAGEGPQDASASQISTSSQAATASAQASQTNVGNVNDVDDSGERRLESGAQPVQLPDRRGGGDQHELHPTDGDPGLGQQQRHGPAEPRGRSAGGREAVR